MIPHKQGVNVKLYIILEALSNKQFSQWGRSSLRNFDILKKKSKKLLFKINLHTILFMHVMLLLVVACYIISFWMGMMLMYMF
jgi:ABC-type uncharacterized transport system YnjBCD permease subunit